ncbi:MAG: hypothetical protein AAFZ74_18280 [Pseudomonadota bacterium]
MKALSIASLFALGVAGTACSQTVDAEAEDPKPVAEESTEVSTDTGGSFNLELPEDLESATNVANDGFNLALPGTEMTNTDGFNLGTDVAASSGLADLPEIAANIAEDPDALELEAPEEDEPEEEPIIRLE